MASRKSGRARTASRKNASSPPSFSCAPCVEPQINTFSVASKTQLVAPLAPQLFARNRRRFQFHVANDDDFIISHAERVQARGVVCAAHLELADVAAHPFPQRPQTRRTFQ